MVITFPILISETVDKEMLPYLIKAVERKFALDYTPILEKHIQDILEHKNKHVSVLPSNYDKPPVLKLILKDELSPLLEADSSLVYGTQVIHDESNRLMTDQPYTITIRVTTAGHITQDFTFGFKGLTLITNDAYEVFERNLDQSRYWVYRQARKLLSDKTVWKLVDFYRKIWGTKDDKRLIYTEKVLFSENTERICILSANDLAKEDFEYSDKDKEPLSVGNLKRSQFSSLYLDDSLNKRIYVWDQSDISFSSIITYDMLFKTSINVLPEQVDKAKQRGLQMFGSRKVPTKFVFKKIMESRKKQS